MSQSRFRRYSARWACLGFALVWGCVDAPVPPDPDEIAPLRAAVAGNPKPPPMELRPEMRRPDHSLHHVHVDGAVACSGIVGKQLTAYAEAWVTSPGYTGERVSVMSLDAEIQVLGGLFEGRMARSPETGAETADVGLVLKGNRFSNPCSCVRLVGNAKAPGGFKIRARRDLCPEGMEIATEPAADPEE